MECGDSVPRVSTTPIPIVIDSENEADEDDVVIVEEDSSFDINDVVFMYEEPGMPQLSGKDLDYKHDRKNKGSSATEFRSTALIVRENSCSRSLTFKSTSVSNSVSSRTWVTYDIKVNVK